jgi:hypothetical protein
VDLSGGKQTPIEAEELLSKLRRDIAQTSTLLRPDSAIHYVGGADRVRTAHEAMKAEASVFGSLPPSPPTVRGRLALSLVWFVHRLVWWQTAAAERFAKAVCEFAQVQIESQAEQHAKIEERLQAIEMKLQELHKPLE